MDDHTSMSLRNDFGANVRHIRERKGWSQDLLSEVSDLHRTYISGIERGVRNPTIDIIERLAEALDVRPSELFKE